jgi:hypothetical protein
VDRKAEERENEARKKERADGGRGRGPCRKPMNGTYAAARAPPLRVRRRATGDLAGKAVAGVVRRRRGALEAGVKSRERRQLP